MLLKSQRNLQIEYFQKMEKLSKQNSAQIFYLFIYIFLYIFSILVVYVCLYVFYQSTFISRLLEYCVTGKSINFK